MTEFNLHFESTQMFLLFFLLFFSNINSSYPGKSSQASMFVQICLLMFAAGRDWL